MNYLTFSNEGLTKNQIKFLDIVEDFFFKGKEIDLNLLDKALKKFGEYNSEIGAEIGEAWEYWTFLPKPLVRKSYKNPLVLDNFLKKPVKKNKGYWLKNAKTDRVIIKPSLKRILEKSGIIYELNPDNYYFEISGDKGNALYIKYQYIIGSRFIAFVK